MGPVVKSGPNWLGDQEEDTDGEGEDRLRRGCQRSRGLVDKPEALTLLPNAPLRADREGVHLGSPVTGAYEAERLGSRARTLHVVAVPHDVPIDSIDQEGVWLVHGVQQAVTDSQESAEVASARAACGSEAHAQLGEDHSQDS